MKKYLLPEGKHDSPQDSFCMHWGKKAVAYKFRFSSTCLYDSVKFDKQRDLNKLCGLSDSLLPAYRDGKFIAPHHLNSMRIAWRPALQTNMIELHLYCYIDGKRHIEFLCNIFPDMDYTVILNLEDGFPTARVIGGNYTPGVKAYKHIPHKLRAKTGYYLYPYFGGDKPAPHLMALYLERI